MWHPQAQPSFCKLTITYGWCIHRKSNDRNCRGQEHEHEDISRLEKYAKCDDCLNEEEKRLEAGRLLRDRQALAGDTSRPLDSKSKGSTAPKQSAIRNILNSPAKPPAKPPAKQSNIHGFLNSPRRPESEELGSSGSSHNPDKPPKKKNLRDDPRSSTQSQRHQQPTLQQNRANDREYGSYNYGPQPTNQTTVTPAYGQRPLSAYLRTPIGPAPSPYLLAPTGPAPSLYPQIPTTPPTRTTGVSRHDDYGVPPLTTPTAELRQIIQEGSRRYGIVRTPESEQQGDRGRSTKGSGERSRHHKKR